MLSIRCIMMVSALLAKLGIENIEVNLGEVEISENLPPYKYHQLKLALSELGLELMDDKKSILIEKIKKVIIELVYYSAEEPEINFSEFLSKKLQYDYTYLSNLFSELEGITIEKFLITHRIELAKQLIEYGELNLTEISWKLHYSSVAHLSNQFKKLTGITPSYYRQMNYKRLPAFQNA